jgi:hypothetical protein
MSGFGVEAVFAGNGVVFVGIREGGTGAFRSFTGIFRVVAGRVTTVLVISGLDGATA